MLERFTPKQREQIQKAVDSQPEGKCFCCKTENQKLFRMVNWHDNNGYCIKCITSERVKNPSGLGFC